MRRGLTWPWIRMRPLLARFSEPVWSGHLPSWADFITTTPELKFSVHTPVPRLAKRWDGLRKIDQLPGLERVNKTARRFAGGFFLTNATFFPRGEIEPYRRPLNLGG